MAAPMPPAPVAAVTEVLAEIGVRDPGAASEVTELVYEHLRALAGAVFRGQPARHTLQPTALVHEAYVRLAERAPATIADEDHFMALAAVIMRNVLADAARSRAAAKRGGDRDAQRVPLTGIETPGGTPGDVIDVLALDDALERLAELSPRQARIVEYRFFGGITVDRIADLLDVSRSTVEADWRLARAWLRVELGRDAT